MLIECKLKRQGGSHITMKDGTVYHFAPDKTGKHVCDVRNKEHVARLLSISEGYEVVMDEPLTVAAPSAPLGGLSKAPPAPTGGSENDDTGEPTTELTGDTETQPTTETSPANEPTGATIDSYAHLERDELARLVTERTGQAPHHKTGKEKLVAVLKSLDEQG